MDKFILGVLFALWGMLLAKGLWVAVGLCLVSIIQTVRIIDIGE